MRHRQAARPTVWTILTCCAAWPTSSPPSSCWMSAAMGGCGTTYWRRSGRTGSSSICATRSSAAATRSGRSSRRRAASWRRTTSICGWMRHPSPASPSTTRRRSSACSTASTPVRWGYVCCGPTASSRRGRWCVTSWVASSGRRRSSAGSSEICAMRSGTGTRPPNRPPDRPVMTPNHRRARRFRLVGQPAPPRRSVRPRHVRLFARSGCARAGSRTVNSSRPPASQNRMTVDIPTRWLMMSVPRANSIGPRNAIDLPVIA